MTVTLRSLCVSLALLGLASATNSMNENSDILLKTSHAQTLKTVYTPEHHQLTATPSAFQGYCFACISDGNKYCASTNTCILANQTCSSGSTYNITTGCPAVAPCKIGINGVGYFGSPQIRTAGYDVNGQLTFNVTAGNPCVMSLWNINKNDLDIKISGAAVGAQALDLSVPQTSASFNTAAASGMRVMPNEVVSFLYIGSLNNRTQTAQVTWSKHVEPTPAAKGAYGLGLSVLSTLIFALTYLFA